MAEEMTVTEMLLTLIEKGIVTPNNKLNDLTFPGEFDHVPSITSYGTPDIVINNGIHLDAKLEQRS